ncbi:GNAT family N-acetyltransferase [Paracoccus nototheniae]|uniref:GNAT family N-acetyltransferase n=1 Tax=Paracoccus nototheniae TaxID=2489002 RepID=A0ABW4E411_9RHOB|nr:GNAT family N-acetyltransferase [Paracoccus nototheniae]
MTAPDAYNVRRATPRDLPLLKAWQSNQHVLQWWDVAEPYGEADLGDPRVTRCIVSIGNRPFAFMQDHTVHGWADQHFAGLHEGSRGIDQSIGNAEMTGPGHGSAFIRQRMQDLFRDGAPVVATDPHPKNKRAIAVYKKIGFIDVGSVRETEWGRHDPAHGCETVLKLARGNFVPRLICRRFDLAAPCFNVRFGEAALQLRLGADRQVGAACALSLSCSRPMIWRALIAARYSLQPEGDADAPIMRHSQ